MRNSIYYIVIFSLLLGSCDYIKSTVNSAEGHQNEKLIAKVGSTELYYSDIANMAPTKMGGKDSSDFIQTYTQKWIKKQLLVAETEKYNDIDRNKINNKVQDFRSQLLIYEMEKEILNKRFSNEIKENEMKQYYLTHSDDYTLNENITQCKFVKINSSNPNLSQLRRLMKSNNSEDAQDLMTFCTDNAETFYLEDTLWFSFDEVIKTTPFEKIDNKQDFLQNTRFSERSDKNFYYFIQIKDFKVVGDVSPYEFNKEKIKNLLLIRKKKMIIEQFGDEIYQDGLKQNKVEIYY